MERYPNALVFGGTYFKNPKPDIELFDKEQALGNRFIYVGQVSSTTDEREAIIKEACALKVRTDRIIIIDDPFHWMRTEIVWKHYHPNSFITPSLISGVKASDWRNPMLAQKFWPVWALANIVFAPSYKYWPGVEWWAKQNFNRSFTR